MISFQDRFKGKMSYISKYGINQSPDIKQNSQILQQDQSNNKSLQKIINLNSKSPIKNSYFYKLPPLKNKIVDRTLNFNQQKQQIQTKKIYSADHSKISLKKYDSDVEQIQMKHLQYLNKIEQLYMLQKN
ncbi:unnamed protein product (macronuclear) [Paramecium tetraurelia]|uniref:Uncharacterized protein n=1 Tax=Paramecium tetraurelia TaxID=5888 RepID=A0C0Y7_PARTE|nr:uncharacterized protein GSPATT00033930001 [Paramecium tetraurelia]CAK64454.1 unnamed protein product [Paramecium tetraurelia]|eukprot:XP_001431852.1 hypothetical protein (macronuclear) [Paramecium tetraurelia strain d4-2]